LGGIPEWIKKLMFFGSFFLATRCFLDQMSGFGFPMVGYGVDSEPFRATSQRLRSQDQISTRRSSCIAPWPHWFGNLACHCGGNISGTF
jgi:hypothetical protein